MYFHRYALVLNEMDEIFSHDQVRVRHSSTAYTRRKRTQAADVDSAPTQHPIPVGKNISTIRLLPLDDIAIEFNKFLAKRHHTKYCRTNLLSHTLINLLPDLQVMTNNIAARNAEDYTDVAVNNDRECPDHDNPYRLWRHGDAIPGNPIIILVHGAVVPVIVPPDCNLLHQINSPNNDRCCFYQLDSLLYEDCHHNVFTFEYACTAVGGFGYVNYGCLKDYGEMLIQAIESARTQSMRPDGTVGAVNIIAHSIGGLVARYAVQDPRAGQIDNLITLDTGHKGFALAAIADNLVVGPLEGLIQLPTLCSKDAEPNSEFITQLNAELGTCPTLWSLCATQPIPSLDFCGILPPPPIEITVVDLSSSNVGNHVHQLPCDHMSIAEINEHDHLAYQWIKYIICPG